MLDEADKLLDLDLGPVIDKILKVVPKERTTYLFSATMTTKVAKLQRASLSNPVRVEVSSKYARLPVVTLVAYNTNLGIPPFPPSYNTTSSSQWSKKM